MDFHFTFNKQRIDYIVNVLAQRPYGEVAETLQDIAQQMNASQLASQVTGDAAKPNGKEATQ